MTTRTRRALLPWILLLLCAVGLAAAGLLAIMPRMICLWAAIVPCATVAVWVCLHFGRWKPDRAEAGISLVRDSAFQEQISAETRQATGRYLDWVKRRGRGRAALYERPWFVVCGPRGAGKSSLLDGAGVRFGLRYPAQDDGAVVAGDERVVWRFADNAVWIDTPGSYMTESGAERWRATVTALAGVRPESPASGAVLVVSAEELLAVEPGDARELAATLRRRIDEAIACWGVELPVYLVSAHTDGIPGFGEFFGPEVDRWSRAVLGATIGEEEGRVPAQLVFGQEHGLLCEALSEQRLRVLASVKDAERRRQICRFPIHFGSLRKKLATLVAELYKKSSYVGRPVFGGFYFTGQRPSADSGSTARPPGSAGPDTMVASHPLNPHQSSKSTVSPSRLPDQVATPRLLFARGLLDEVLPAQGGPSRLTQSRTRRETTRTLATVGACVLAGAALAAVVVCSAIRVWNMVDRLAPGLRERPGAAGSMADRQRSLGRMARSIAELEREVTNGPPLHLPLGYGVAQRLLDGARGRYVTEARPLILAPCVSYLEYVIRDHTGSYGDLEGGEYGLLYTALKAYLSLSEAVAAERGVVDTAFMRPVLANAVKQALAPSLADGRLAEDVETAVAISLGLLLRYLQSGHLRPVQEDQYLVSEARQRLVRLPDAGALYRTVVGRVSRNMPEATLGDLLGDRKEPLLESDATIDLIYSPEGWSRHVADAVEEACADPYRIDWVMGRSRRDFPESMLDPRRLRRDMAAAYAEDAARRWLDFVGAVRVVPFTGTADAARRVQRLGADGSELMTFLEKVAQHTAIRTDGRLAEAGRKAAGALQNALPAGKVAERARKESGVGESTDSDAAGNVFDYLRKYLRTAEPGPASIGAWHQSLAELARALANAESQDAEGIVALFNGLENDPLWGAWQAGRAALGMMPDELAASMLGVLMGPADLAGEVVGRRLCAEMNERWQADIARPFTTRLSERYPFRARDDAAALEQVMDFFRPANGVLWGFHERNLKPYLVRNGSAWESRQVGSVSIPFTTDLLAALASADAIRRAFFRTDGTQRRITFVLSAVAGNTYRASIDIDGITDGLSAGDRAVRILWPSEGVERPGATLRIHIDGSFTQEIVSDGPWGFMRLLEMGSVERLAPGVFTVRWKANVQSMYAAFVTCRLQVSEPEFAPAGALFGRFACPETIARADSLVVPAAASPVP